MNTSTKPIIAIAEDNPLACEVLTAVLADLYDVRAFRSGQTLLAGLAQDPVDLILLDVAMPGLDGYETCRRLRKETAQPDVPVFFLSAHAQLEDRLRGYAAGGDDYLVKPYEDHELLAKIHVAIESHHQTRRLAGDAAELSNAASLTAEMMGEVGVVLEFHRALADCTTPGAIASAVLASLGRLGLEGCVRLESRGTTLAYSAAGAASTLEVSLLEYLAAQQGASILTLGHNLGFALGTVTLLVRSLAWAEAPDSPETADAMGRARDNVALVVDGAVVRLRALEAEQDARRLVGAQDLIATTRTALMDLEAIEHGLHRELDGVFEALREEFEMRFPQLGLTAAQEDSLAEILSRQHARGLAVLERGRVAEVRLHRLVEQLEQAPPGA